MRDIQKLIGKELPIEKNHPYPITEADALSAPPAPQSFRPEGRYNQRGGNPRSGNSGSGAPRSDGPRKGHPRRQYARREEF
jgi:hypothetical protein